MVSHGRVELLAHPLSQKYLQMKWNAYGKYFHVTNLLIYTVFLSFVTLYASQLMRSVDKCNITGDGVRPLSHNSSAEVLHRNFKFTFSFSCNFSFILKLTFNVSFNPFSDSRKRRDWCIPNRTTLTIAPKHSYHKILLTNKSTWIRWWWYLALQSLFTSCWAHSVNSYKSTNKNGSTYSNRTILYRGCFMFRQQ